VAVEVQQQEQETSWFDAPAATGVQPPPARQTPDSARGFLDAFQRGVQRGLPDRQESR